MFILTDDQSLAMDPAGIPLGDMQPMVQTRKLLIEGGLHMANWFVNTPVCCPSRSEYLSGRYAHNIRDNHFENSFDCDDYNLSAPITCGCMRMNSTIDSFENAHVGIPTPLSPLFLGRFSPVLRRFSAAVLRFPAFWRRDGANGRKMAETGRNLGEKRARNSGG